MSTFIFAATRPHSVAHPLSLFALHPPWYKRLLDQPPTLSNGVLTFLCFQRRLGSSIGLVRFAWLEKSFWTPKKAPKTFLKPSEPTRNRTWISAFAGLCSVQLILWVPKAHPERFELPTFWFEARHSVLLSYGCLEIEGTKFTTLTIKIHPHVVHFVGCVAVCVQLVIPFHRILTGHDKDWKVIVIERVEPNNQMRCAFVRRFIQPS